LCGIIGYLLRNTDASDRQIAELIDCDRFDVAMFVRDVSRALDTETIVSGDGINATLNTILSEVQTELASDKFPQLSGSVLRFPTKHQVRSDFATEAERIVDGVMTFLPKSLKETGQKPDIVRVRDVFFFLLAARTNLTYPKIGSLLDRGISQVASSVFRFRNPDEARRQLLGEVCEYMGINAQEMLAWKGRKDRD
jgi:hypothetical protein